MTEEMLRKELARANRMVSWLGWAVVVLWTLTGLGIVSIIDMRMTIAMQKDLIEIQAGVIQKVGRGTPPPKIQPKAAQS